jgi:hypothetical protein
LEGASLEAPGDRLRDEWHAVAIRVLLHMRETCQSVAYTSRSIAAAPHANLSTLAQTKVCQARWHLQYKLCQLL